MMKRSLCLLFALLLLPFAALAADYSNEFTNFDQRDGWTAAVTVNFTDDSVTINGSGAAAEGTTVYITAEGTYFLTGACKNGQIVVQVSKTEKVQLVLGGLNLTCTDSAPLYVISADKVGLTLAPETVNTFTDGSAYTRAFEKKPNAAISARDDLTINGAGELIVNGNFNNGIGSENDLKIVGGKVTVTAVKNALKGDDSVAIKGGTLSLTCGKDGIKADSSDEPGKGYVYIEDGTITINAGDDGIQGQTDVTIKGGSIKINSKGKTVNSKGTQDVASGVISRK